jgi:hypothetical protein
VQSISAGSLTTVAIAVAAAFALDLGVQRTATEHVQTDAVRL